MKKLLKLLTAAALIGGLWTAQASADTIKFSVAAEPYPPFASKSASGKWEGFEIDLIHAICEHLKPSKCEVKETAWDGIIPALTSKKIDVIFASMSITAERQKTIDFSIPYYTTPAAIAARKDSQIDTTAASVTGKTIGVQTATIHENYAKKYFGADATIKIYNTQDDANADLAAGRIDATIADSAALEPFINDNKNIELKGFYPKNDPIFGDGVGAGIRKGDKVKDRIDDAIRAIYKDGTYAKLEKKYFKYDVGTPPKM